MENKSENKSVQLTFDEYDEILEKFEHVKSETFWPSLAEIDKMEEDPGKWMLYACFLLEKGKEPVNNAEKYSKKNLSAFVNKYLELVDEEEDVIQRPMYI